MLNQNANLPPTTQRYDRQENDPWATGTGQLASLATQTFVVLTTYRRDGTPVDTPVNIAVAGDRAYIPTGRKTAKVRRILRDSRVTVAPSTARGRATGPAIEAAARLLDGDEARQARAYINRKHPIIHKVLLPLQFRLTKTTPALLELAVPATR